MICERFVNLYWRILNVQEDSGRQRHPALRQRHPLRSWHSRRAVRDPGMNP